jgi:branched-chain amino acid transport system permease protein
VSIWVFMAVMIVAAVAVRLAPRVPRDWRIIASLLVIGAFLVWAPFELDGYRTFQLSRIGVFVVVAMGLNILTGYNGQISLGHGALLLLGAYTFALLTDKDNQLGFLDTSPWPFYWAIIMAAVVTTVAGFLIAIPALRLSGPYLAIATLAVAISFPQILRKYDDVTNGTQGVLVHQPPPPPGLDSFLDRTEWMYFLSVFTAAVMLLVAWSILRGPLGRAFVAVRDSEVAAAAMGINVSRTKVAAFTISAFYAGVAGGIYALLLGTVTPDTVTIIDSINFLTAIVIGGLGSILGSVIGAAALIFLPSDAPDFIGKLPIVSSDVVQRAPGAIQGAIVIIVILLMPGGIAGSWHRLRRIRPRAVLAAIRGIPATLRDRLDRAQEDLQWAWEDMPWKKRRLEEWEEE